MQSNEALSTVNSSACESAVDEEEINWPCFLVGCTIVVLPLTFCPPIVVEQEIVNDLVLSKLELAPWSESVLDVDECVPLHVPLVPLFVTVVIVAAVASYVYDASFTS